MVHSLKISKELSISVKIKQVSTVAMPSDTNPRDLLHVTRNITCMASHVIFFIDQVVDRESPVMISHPVPTQLPFHFYSQESIGSLLFFT